MENSPIFKKHYQQFIEGLMNGWEVERRQIRKSQTERHVILIICLIILGFAAASYLVANSTMEGSYCEYPDPYGR